MRKQTVELCPSMPQPPNSQRFPAESIQVTASIRPPGELAEPNSPSVPYWPALSAGWGGKPSAPLIQTHPAVTGGTGLPVPPEPLGLPGSAGAPNLNAYAEMFVRTIKDECLNRMIFLGARSIRYAIGEFVEHYHVERNHQGLENRIPRPVSFVYESNARVRMLQYYHRAAA
jgi:Integrase core domain